MSTTCNVSKNSGWLYIINVCLQLLPQLIQILIHSKNLKCNVVLKLNIQNSLGTVKIIIQKALVPFPELIKYNCN